ncbi:glycosyltransferase family 4 protein [Priestia megaterium]|uniref:glycosyltransferase family 4 protein n=1 Tax=Priestia megaterium TaxID=1404 RepID=UPI00203DDDFD|nr:glycosyltransferase family 4 protein [Priestia megaterium]MCM3186889.1 glycosyltransferase family 4 protein [Priestia megaterium]
MKILLATFWEVPHVGGVWNYMQQLKQELEGLGHEVDLLGHGIGNKSVHIVNRNLEIVKDELSLLEELEQHEKNNPILYKDPVVKFYEKERIGYTRGVARLDINQYDLIHTQDVVATACIRSLKTITTPMVATIHGCVAHELNRYTKDILKAPTADIATKYFNELEHTGAMAADCTIVANNWLKEILIQEFGVEEAQLKVFHYGYDIASFFKRMQTPSKIHPPVGQQVIIYTGRLAEIKGIHHLLTALSELKKIKKGWVCWIVGDGDQKAELKAQSRALGLGKRVLFLGNRNDVPALLSLANIFVLPSLIENQPLSVIEAQIAKKPVIVSDAGGLPEMVQHGSTGLISPAGNTTLLCKNLYDLLINATYRDKLGANAQEWALKHWSQKDAVQKVLEVYENVLSYKDR